MRLAIVVSAALVAGASAQWNGTTVYTTDVVTAYTTYCPAATSIVHGNQTYVATEATTLTITNCPCTVTKPVLTSTIGSCNTCFAVSTTAAATPISTSPVVGPTYANSSTAAAIPATSVPSLGLSTTASPSASSSPFKGAASKVFAASGLGVTGLLSLAIYFL